MATQHVQQLIRMGNQIAGNFVATYGHDAAIIKTEDHLRRFWAVDMRAALADSVVTQHNEIDEVLLSAVERLQSCNTG
ncbi:MAG: formate dehydrogenase subunit delta [Halioglobus sp.]